VFMKSFRYFGQVTSSSWNFGFYYVIHRRDAEVLECSASLR
jgi:hypothetical protein